MIKVTPIRYTPNMDANEELLLALGLRKSYDSPSFRVFEADSGSVALHASTPADSYHLTTDFRFSSDSRESLSEAVRSAGFAAEVSEQPHGMSMRVEYAAGMSFWVDAARDPIPAGSDSPAVTVNQIAFVRNVPRFGELLDALGLRAQLRSNDGEFISFSAPGGGQVMDHDLGSSVASTESLSAFGLEYDGDARQLLERLEGAGLRGSVADESYGRTLLLEDPDHPGKPIWINEKPTDLYGYQAL